VAGDFDPWFSSAVAAEVALVSHAGAPAVRARQRSRLADLIAAAVRTSRLYRELYVGIDVAHAALTQLPVVRKRELMQRFDDWVTDDALRLAEVRRFIADPACIGMPYLDRYIVWESSGSGGEPGVFVQDARSLAVLDALEALRRPVPRPLTRLLDPFYVGERIAFVGAIDGHFAGTVAIKRLQRLNPALAPRLHTLSFLQPPRALMRELEALAPTIVATYPSEALSLAEECAAGRLHLSLRELWCGGETLTPSVRRVVQQAFGCAIVDSYGASEFLSIASQCEHGQLHLNADWVILEPVDEHGRAAPAGEFGATTLLTNLANRVQPLIRYDIGDRVALPAQACACGSNLPVIAVQGRSDDCLVVPRDDQGALRVSPLAVTTVLEEQAGLYDFQLQQLAPAELRLCTPLTGDAAHTALRRGRSALGHYLSEQGAVGVHVHCCGGQPHAHGRSGKVQRVVAV
jgi:phenylacetate-coenzyme A ligase PaaK-like adenylate-forming protein